MRKVYIRPLITVVEIAMNQRLLAGSTPGYGGGSDAIPQSRENFYFDDTE